MSQVPVIQYLPLTKPLASHRFVQKLDKAKVMSILDLEDSAQDPFDLGKTRTLKKEARNGLVYISSNCEWPVVSKIYVRVNSINTEFFEDDINSVIIAKRNGMPITGIFLPKVESYGQVQDVDARFRIADLNLEIVPMAETFAGLNNLQEMLDNDRDAGLFQRIHYGHFDYCLDAKIWPFPEPNHESFWDIIKPMIKILSAYKKGYVHTPFPFIYDSAFFWKATAFLRLLHPDLEMWSCTLNSELSLSAKIDNLRPLDVVDGKYSREQIIVESRNICDGYMGGRANKRSFGISKERFIPPHQYIAAKNFLDSLEETTKTV